MNMPRYIFSYTLVIIFSLAAFLSLVPKPADADKPTCPCPFARLYNASINQAESLGLTNEVETCFEDSNGLFLQGDNSPCVTGMQVNPIVPYCAYYYICAPYYYYYNGDTIYLSPEEVNACRFELELIARQNRISCE